MSNMPTISLSSARTLTVWCRRPIWRVPGRQVLVLDRANQPGGTVITEEVFPGFRFNTVQHDAGWLNPAIVKDLNLAQYGLTLIQSEVTAFEPGSGLALWRDEAKSARAIAHFSKSDAEKWPAFSAQLLKLAGFLEKVDTLTPPQITTTNPGGGVVAADAGPPLARIG